MTRLVYNTVLFVTYNYNCSTNFMYSNSSIKTNEIDCWSYLSAVTNKETTSSDREFRKWRQINFVHTLCVEVSRSKTIIFC